MLGRCDFLVTGGLSTNLGQERFLGFPHFASPVLTRAGIRVTWGALKNSHLIGPRRSLGISDFLKILDGCNLQPGLEVTGLAGLVSTAHV